MDSIRLDIIVAIYCYLEKEIYRVLKCHTKSSSYFEIRASLSLSSATLQKAPRTSVFQNK